MALRLTIWLAAVAAGSAAAEFWESKPYTRWSEQEIARVLVDSPWAKEVFIRFEGELEARIRAQQATTPPPPASVSGVGQQQGRGSGGDGPLGSMVGRKRDPVPTGTTVRVRWESAKPLREAIAATKGTPVEPAPSHYTLVIDQIPPYMESREPANLREVLLAITELNWEKDPTPVRPTDAKVLANADGLVVRLEFPRRAGAPPAGTVELHTRIGISRVKCAFALKAMKVSGRLEL